MAIRPASGIVVDIAADDKALVANHQGEAAADKTSILLMYRTLNPDVLSPIF